MVTVCIPATSANLGPGFDCMGIALTLYNEIDMAEAPDGPDIEITGEGADIIPRDENNTVYGVAMYLLGRLGRRPRGLRLRQRNGVPVQSGLGSSSTAIVGGLVAANALVGRPLAKEELLGLAAEIEGHPDNVAPALLGGLVVASSVGRQVDFIRVPVPELKIVVAVPAIRVSTPAARALLPDRIPHADAVFNIGKAVLVVLALERGDYDLLSRAMHDRLHQPYRAPLIPGLMGVFASAREAGAAGVAISGAGPSLIAFAPNGHEQIGQAMVAAFEKAGLPARALVLDVEREGARVVG
jgi:homoserine kinase